METEIYRFETERFAISAIATPCDDDPAECFQFDEDIEMVRNGECEWFDVIVTVELDGQPIGDDCLCACAYKTIDEFVEGHRDADPLNRNSSIMRAAKGDNVAICHYFPDMIHQAIRDARQNLIKTKSIYLRTA